jgi:hypothetical protein
VIADGSAMSYAAPMEGPELVALIREHREATVRFIALVMEDPSTADSLNLIRQLNAIVDELDGILFDIERSEARRKPSVF